MNEYFSDFSFIEEKLLLNRYSGFINYNNYL